MLPVEADPILYDVKTNDVGGLDDSNTKLMLINLQLLYGSLDKCNATILQYNNAQKQSP